MPCKVKGATCSGRQNRKQPGLKMGVYLSYPTPALLSRLQHAAVLFIWSFICLDVCPVSCIMTLMWLQAWPFEHQLHHCACDVQFPVDTVFDSIHADTHCKSPVPVKPGVDIFGLFVILMQLISMHKTLSWLFALPGTKKVTKTTKNFFVSNFMTCRFQPAFQCV